MGDDTELSSTTFFLLLMFDTDDGVVDFVVDFALPILCNSKE
jgi:hypothetical protein